jgi:hypothetical protein
LKKFVVPIFILAVFLTAADFASLENRLFDVNKTDPRTFLQIQYDKAQVLALGETNHSQFRVHEHLMNLIKANAMDPKLRFVVIERSQDFTQFYETISELPYNDLVKFVERFTEGDMKSAICSRSFAANPYMVARFFPFLRNINDRRKDMGFEPILVKGIDMPYSMFLSTPQMGGSIREAGCKIPLGQARKEETQDRERVVAANFKTMILDNLGHEQKAIVLYHIGHLIQGFDACLPKLKDGEWESSRAPMNWLSMFLTEQPQLRSKFRIIAMDEKEAGRGVQSSEGLFRFSKRQSDRYPDESFGVSMKPFTLLQTETNRDVFVEKTVMRRHLGGRIRSPWTLPQMIDGVVWSADAHTSFVLKSASFYLPGFCF